MAWKESKVQEQRMEFVIAVSRRQATKTKLCQEFGISRPTGDRWLKRYSAEGIEGIKELSRRPHSSPRRTETKVEEQVVQLRQGRPDWGARKLQHLLRQQEIQLPATTIHRILERYDLIRDCDRRVRAVQRFEREQPNQLWQMDFKGPKGWDEPVGPLSVLDDHSRYALALDSTGSTQAEGVQTVLERVFREHGVPEQMLMDHGTPWFNAQAHQGWTRLTVWLMDQDIRLYFSGIRHPQTQGKVERFHRTLTQALLRRGTPEESHRQVWLDDFRHEYNCVRPHEALQMRTPRQIWHKSPRAYQQSPCYGQYPAGSDIRELDKGGQLRFGNRRYAISKALAGRPVRLAEVEKRTLVYYRQTLLCELDPSSPRPIPATGFSPVTAGGV
jgi:transposase InsO family protein